MFRIRKVVLLVHWANWMTSCSHGTAEFLEVKKVSNWGMSIQGSIVGSRCLGLDKPQVTSLRWCKTFIQCVCGMLWKRQGNLQGFRRNRQMQMYPAGNDFHRLPGHLEEGQHIHFGTYWQLCGEGNFFVMSFVLKYHFMVFILKPTWIDVDKVLLISLSIPPLQFCSEHRQLCVSPKTSHWRSSRASPLHGQIIGYFTLHIHDSFLRDVSLSTNLIYSWCSGRNSCAWGK